MTGRKWERKFVRTAEDDGWRCLPAGSSGSGTHRDRPDVLMGKAEADIPPLALELKTTRDNAETIAEAEADQLRRWAEGFGAVPAIGIYWKGPPGGNVSYGGWYFRELSEVRRSPQPNAAGGHHLRPRRENRREWAQFGDLNEGRLLPE